MSRNTFIPLTLVALIFACDAPEEAFTDEQAVEEVTIDTQEPAELAQMVWQTSEPEPLAQDESPERFRLMAPAPI